MWIIGQETNQLSRFFSSAGVTIELIMQLIQVVRIIYWAQVVELFITWHPVQWSIHETAHRTLVE